MFYATDISKECWAYACKHCRLQNMFVGRLNSDRTLFCPTITTVLHFCTAVFVTFKRCSCLKGTIPIFIISLGRHMRTQAVAQSLVPLYKTPDLPSVKVALPTPESSK